MNVQASYKSSDTTASATVTTPAKEVSVYIWTVYCVQVWTGMGRHFSL